MIRTLQKKNRQKGFTMLEIVAVLVILGIISIVAISRISDIRTYDLNSQREAVKAHLRRVQSLAMGSSAPYGINFSATTYFVFQGTNTTIPILLNGEDSAVIDLAAKKSKLTVTNIVIGNAPFALPQTVTFDAYGSPGTANVTVVTNGGNIDITKNTGFIP